MKIDKTTGLKIVGLLMTIGGTLLSGYVRDQETAKSIDKSVNDYLDKKQGS